MTSEIASVLNSQMYSLYLNDDFDQRLQFFIYLQSLLPEKTWLPETNSARASAGSPWTISPWLTRQELFGDDPQIFQWSKVGSWHMVVLNCEEVNCVKEEPKTYRTSKTSLSAVLTAHWVWGPKLKSGVFGDNLSHCTTLHRHTPSHPPDTVPHCPQLQWSLSPKRGIRLFLTSSPSLSGTLSSSLLLLPTPNPLDVANF